MCNSVSIRQFMGKLFFKSFLHTTPRYAAMSEPSKEVVVFSEGVDCFNFVMLKLQPQLRSGIPRGA